ncbi:UNVERIFIED_CONTAM: peptide/nickel transport system permease protein [Brevibacillus sp. OAP136]
MLFYTVRRLLSLIPVLLGMTLIVFMMIHFIPGDPVGTILGNKATEETKEAMRHELGLYEPLHIQYLTYLKKLAQGDLGHSIRTNAPISEEIGPYLAATLELTLVSVSIAIFAGIHLGILSAWKEKSWFDYMVMLLALLAVSLPLFWLALMEQWIFALKLKWLPSVGRLGAGESVKAFTHLYVIDTLLAGRLDQLWTVFKHLILPSVTLAVIPTAIIARQTRSSLLEVLSSDYIRTARAKGLSQMMVVYRHAMKNALIPIVTLVGLMVGSLLGSAVLTEVIFGWPGMGRYIYQAISYRDYPVIQSGVLTIATIFMVINLVVDLLYACIDPRVKYQ